MLSRLVALIGFLIVRAQFMDLVRDAPCFRGAYRVSSSAGMKLVVVCWRGSAVLMVGERFGGISEGVKRVCEPSPEKRVYCRVSAGLYVFLIAA